MKPIKVLSFDLGSKMGWASTICDVKNRSMVVSKFGTIDLNDKLVKSGKYFEGSFVAKPLVRLQLFEEIVDKLTSKLVYDAFVSEDVFFQMNRLASYRSLLLYITSLEKIVNVNRMKPLYKIAPKGVKKAISVGTAGKMDVQLAVLENPDIHFKTTNENEPVILDEHSGDAIAVSWAFMTNMTNMINLT